MGTPPTWKKGERKRRGFVRVIACLDLSTVPDSKSTSDSSKSWKWCFTISRLLSYPGSYRQKPYFGPRRHETQARPLGPFYVCGGTVHQDAKSAQWELFWLSYNVDSPKYVRTIYQPAEDKPASSYYISPRSKLVN